MKVILPFQSSAAIRAQADEVVPELGMTFSELIAFVGDTYQFALKPQYPPNTPPVMMQNLIFQAGNLITEKDKYAILQLALVQNGDIATAATTDVADLILDDLVQKLDGQLKFRYAKAEKRQNLSEQFSCRICKRV